MVQIEQFKGTLQTNTGHESIQFVLYFRKYTAQQKHKYITHQKHKYTVQHKHKYTAQQKHKFAASSTFL